MKNMPELYTEKQAAAYLGMSVDTLRRQRKAVEIFARQLSPRTIRYTADDLNAFLEHRRSGAVPKAKASKTVAEPTISPAARREGLERANAILGREKP